MTDIQQIRADLRLSDQRLQHTEGVIKAALALADRHYPDLSPERVELAALMHDYTKEFTPAQHFTVCARYGIELTDDERHAPKLLHARTAAAIAQHVYGLPADVCGAIRWHTTGKAAMTPLELVVYLADYIEENRTHPACIRLREYYEKECQSMKRISRALNKTLVRSFDSTIRDLMASRMPIDVNTFEARNYYLRLL